MLRCNEQEFDNFLANLTANGWKVRETRAGDYVLYCCPDGNVLAYIQKGVYMIDYGYIDCKPAEKPIPVENKLAIAFFVALAIVGIYVIIYGLTKLL